MTEPCRDIDPVAESLLHVEVAITDLDAQLPRALEAGGSAVRLLADVDAAWRRLGAVRADLERKVAAELRPRVKPYDIDGVTVQIGGGRQRQFTDHRELAWRVTETALADEDTGEVVEEKAAWRLLDRLLSTLPERLFWKVTVLRELRVDFEDLEAWQERRKTARIVVADPKPAVGSEDGAQ